MTKQIFKVGLICALVGLVLAIANPSEEQYLRKVSADYGEVHGGLEFSPAELLELGSGDRNSYFIFSTYRYEFGTIGVRYFGIGFKVVYVNSYRKDEPKNLDKDDSDEGILV